MGRRWRAGTSTTSTEGELSVRQWAGTAPTVLFLHGLGSTGWHASPSGRRAPPRSGDSTRSARPRRLVRTPRTCRPRCARRRPGCSGRPSAWTTSSWSATPWAPTSLRWWPSVWPVGPVADGAAGRRTATQAAEAACPEVLGALEVSQGRQKGLGPWQDVDAFVAAGMAPGLTARPDLLPVVTEWVRDDLVGEPGRLIPRGDVDRMIDDAVDSFFGDTDRDVHSTTCPYPPICSPRRMAPPIETHRCWPTRCCAAGSSASLP